MIKSVLVDFYAGSYQYKDAQLHEVEDEKEFEKLKKNVKDQLVADKLGSAKGLQSKTFWAAFNEWDTEKGGWSETEELFNERVKV